MKITNKKGLPEPFYNAATGFGTRTPKEKSVSVTQLIGPPKIRVLTKRYWDQIEEDASQRVWAIMGTMGHAVIEASDPDFSDAKTKLMEAIQKIRDGSLQDAEKLWKAAFDHAVDSHTNDSSYQELFLAIERDGWAIRGRCDYVKQMRKVSDYKFTSTWSYIFEKGGKEDWITQQNVYAHMLREIYDADIEELEIVCIFRDWSATKFEREADYPDQVESIKLPLWTPEEAETYLMERLALHQAAEETLPQCTDSERWAKTDKWAVKMPRKKKALRVLDSEEKAKEWADFSLSEDDRMRVKFEYRPGESIRCGRYCSVIAFCSQGQNILQGG